MSKSETVIYIFMTGQIQFNKNRTLFYRRIFLADDFVTFKYDRESCVLAIAENNRKRIEKQKILFVVVVFSFISCSKRLHFTLVESKPKIMSIPQENLQTQDFLLQNFLILIWILK